MYQFLATVKKLGTSTLLPLGKTQHYVIRVGFQVRVSPDILLFIWILNAPKLTKFNIGEYTKWVDIIVRSDLPVNEPILFERVKTYQIHHHSKTCRKYRDEKCRFHFGKTFTVCTIIAHNIPHSKQTKLGIFFPIISSSLLLLH